MEEHRLIHLIIKVHPTISLWNISVHTGSMSELFLGFKLVLQRRMKGVWCGNMYDVQFTLILYSYLFCFDSLPKLFKASVYLHWKNLLPFQVNLRKMRRMRSISERSHLMSSPKCACTSPTKCDTPTAPRRSPNSQLPLRLHWNC